jgi:hypothetical protein
MGSLAMEEMSQDTERRVASFLEETHHDLIGWDGKSRSQVEGLAETVQFIMLS